MRARALNNFKPEGANETTPNDYNDYNDYNNYKQFDSGTLSRGEFPYHPGVTKLIPPG